MKALVTIATLVFWGAVAGVNLMAAGAAPGAATAPTAPTAPTGSGASGASGTLPAQFTLAEVARHADAKSCWMAIDGSVYDFTAYLPRHPAAPQAMLRHCGKEASEAFRTKDAGRPHSPYAAQLLKDYRIGALRP
ncbi:MAG TPA: cytochrome b5-like heme/steroid binding domain-containing protein [Quisquiliibacterium sp.]|nr:cytochrome b5-like heme/steroid binding domain-containing protein [Quisquiliibacterium sp.]